MPSKRQSSLPAKEPSYTTSATRHPQTPAKEAIAKILQRASTNSPSLNAKDVLVLQKTIGNQAVVQLLEDNSTTSDVIQRARKKQKTNTRRAAVVVKDQVIKSVSFKSAHRPATGKGKQGDHTTSFVSITAMLKNAVHGSKIAEFRKNLDPVVEHLLGLTGMKSKQWGPYLRQELQNKVIAPAEEISTNGGNGTAVGTVLYDLAAIFNQVPGGTIIHATSTGGHNEGYKNARLQDAENRLRSTQNVPYSADDLASDMWGMFDYHPTKSLKDSYIINKIADHINTISMSFRLTVSHIGGKAYLCDRLEAEFASEIFNKMASEEKRIGRIIEKVRDGVGG